jgi:predicted PurR-regulated permease PerM
VALEKHASNATAYMTQILYYSARFTVQFIVSMIFSLIIMLDLPKIKKGVASLKHSNIKVRPHA